MNYTNLTLFAIGVLGVLLHNLVELNKINKAKKTRVNIGEYLKIEVFSILIALVTIVVAIIIKTEIKQLDNVGRWLGLAFVSIGYMGQSLVIALIGKASKTIK